MVMPSSVCPCWKSSEYRVTQPDYRALAAMVASYLGKRRSASPVTPLAHGSTASSPSFKPSTSTIAAGRRMARLLPHLEPCIANAFRPWIITSKFYIQRRAGRCSRSDSAVGSRNALQDNRTQQVALAVVRHDVKLWHAEEHSRVELDDCRVHRHACEASG